MIYDSWVLADPSQNVGRIPVVNEILGAIFARRGIDNEASYTQTALLARVFSATGKTPFKVSAPRFSYSARSRWKRPATGKPRRKNFAII